VRLLRDPLLRWAQAIGWAYVVLVVVFLVTGGKPYYVAGMFPVLVASGARPILRWQRRGRTNLRRAMFAAGVVLTAVESVLITLPVVPVEALHSTPIATLNYDAGETVGWPTYVHQIADVYGTLSPGRRSTAAIVTSNYGEAGAVDHYGQSLGLPNAYSGHTGYWYWGPPAPSVTTIVAVGFGRRFLDQSFGDVRMAGRLRNTLQLKNDEQGAPVWLCSQVQGNWRSLWPRFRHA
jgi:hypothetical protein